MRLEQPTPEERDKQDTQLPHKVVLGIHRGVDEVRNHHIAKTIFDGWAAQDAAKAKQAERAEGRAPEQAEPEPQT